VCQSSPGSGELRQFSFDSSRPSRNCAAGTVRCLLFLFVIVTVLHPPALAQCTLRNVQGILPKAAFTPHTITVTADCGAGASAGIDWGDGTFSNGTSPLVVSHTFSSTVQPPYDVIVNQQSSSSLYVTFPSPSSPSATFAGVKPLVTAPVAVLPLPPIGPPVINPPITIHFKCGSAIDSNGNLYPDASAAPLYITCSSIPANVPFAPNQAQDVTVEVGTSGLASTFGSVRFPTKETYVAWAMMPIVFFLGVIRRRRARLGSLLGVCAILCLSLSITSCGGGFSSPSGTQATQAGQYQVNVISVVPDGFVQTTLIVPLTVSPTQ
jgi:hypothetical protein